MTAAMVVPGNTAETYRHSHLLRPLRPLRKDLETSPQSVGSTWASTADGTRDFVGNASANAVERSRPAGRSLETIVCGDHFVWRNGHPTWLFARVIPAHRRNSMVGISDHD